LESRDRKITTIENARLVESACAEFNGTSSRVDVPLGEAVIYNDGSISFDFKRNGASGGTFHALYNRVKAGGSERLQIWIDNTTNKLTFFTTAVHTSSYVVDLLWHSYNIVFSGTTISITIDDVFIEDITGVTFANFATPVDHSIANYSSRYTNGLMCNFILKVGSVQKLNYPFQKSTYDISGNDNHGTPSNITWGTQDYYHYNIIYGFDKYTDDATGLIEVLVPYVDGSPIVSSIASYTKQSSHPAGYWHNGAETKFIIGATTYDTGDEAWNVSSEVQTADVDHILHSASTAYGIPMGYDDMVAEQGEYLFIDVSEANKYKNVLLYKDKQTGLTSIRIHRFVNNGDNLIVDDNNDYVCEDDAPADYPVWEE